MLHGTQVESASHEVAMSEREEKTRCTAAAAAATVVVVVAAGGKQPPLNKEDEICTRNLLRERKTTKPYSFTPTDTSNGTESSGKQKQQAQKKEKKTHSDKRTKK